MRHFVVNLLIGICLTAFLKTPWIETNSTIEKARNAIIVWQMNQLIGVERGKNLAWIVIDEEAYQEWGVQHMTRRDKLADLIAFAVKGKPSAIIVDIDLTLPAKAYPVYDEVLKRYLQSYPRTCTKPCPQILLARTLTRSPIYAYAGLQSKAANMARASFLDGVLGTTARDPWSSNGHILWGSVGVDPEQNGLVSRWRLWEATCDAPGPSSVVPSAVLLAVALAHGLTPTQIRSALEPHAADCVQKSGGNSRTSLPRAREVTTTLNIGRPLALTGETFQRRIAYRIPWDNPDSKTSRPTLGEVLLAGPITKNAAATPTILNGQIVVIGASFRDGGDLHPTPVGEMPGSLILINELNALSQGEQLKPVNWAVALVIETFLILVISALFAALSPMWAIVVSVGIVVAGSLTIGFVAFKSGVWVDSVIPLAGVLFHEVITRTHENAAKISARIAATLRRLGKK